MPEQSRYVSAVLLVTFSAFSWFLEQFSVVSAVKNSMPVRSVMAFFEQSMDVTFAISSALSVPFTSSVSKFSLT